jgi:hypothetical protein
MKLNTMNNLMHKRSIQTLAATVLGALAIGSSAGADGLSAELSVPLTPFSVGGAVHYTYEVVPNLFVGGSLAAAFVPGPVNGFAVLGRLGTKYIINLTDANNLKADAYVGAGANAIYATAFVPSLDLNAGARATYSISPGAKLYGGLDAVAGFAFVPTGAAFVPSVFAYFGGKVEPVTNLEVYAQTGLGFTDRFGYDLKLGAYYTVIPEVRLGASVGFDGSFRAAIGAQFAQKPGTLATPGNFLP